MIQRSEMGGIGDTDNSFPENLGRPDSSPQRGQGKSFEVWNLSLGRTLRVRCEQLINPEVPVGVMAVRVISAYRGSAIAYEFTPGQEIIVLPGNAKFACEAHWERKEDKATKEIKRDQGLML
jgi:hypothetical protein